MGLQRFLTAQLQSTSIALHTSSVLLKFLKFKHISLCLWCCCRGDSLKGVHSLSSTTGEGRLRLTPMLPDTPALSEVFKHISSAPSGSRPDEALTATKSQAMWPDIFHVVCRSEPSEGNDKPETRSTGLLSRSFSLARVACLAWQHGRQSQPAFRCSAFRLCTPFDSDLHSNTTEIVIHVSEEHLDLYDLPMMLTVL